eukprot:3208054-Rhodomonas_salina.2
MVNRKPPADLKFPERKWVFGMEAVKPQERGALIEGRGHVEPTGQLVPKDIEVKNESEESKREKKKAYVEKKAWDVALAPGKQLPMTGNQQRIFIDQKVAVFDFMAVLSLLSFQFRVL